MIQSIDRAVEILNLLSEYRDGLPVSEISRITGLPLSTSHRLLQSLIDNLMVVQDDITKHYKLGVRILNLAVSLLNNNRLIDVCRPHMTKLVARTKKLVYLCLEQRGEVICVDCAFGDGKINMQFYVQIGSMMPFHASASSKIIFAYHTLDIVQTMCERNAPLYRYTEKTKTDPNEIEKDYQQCRERGFAICDEEMENGVFAVAAPIFSYDQKPVASVATISLKEADVSNQMIEDIVACARDISRDMGYMPRKQWA